MAQRMRVASLSSYTDLSGRFLRSCISMKLGVYFEAAGLKE